MQLNSKDIQLDSVLLKVEDKHFGRNNSVLLKAEDKHLGRNLVNNLL